MEASEEAIPGDLPTQVSGVILLLIIILSLQCNIVFTDFQYYDSGLNAIDCIYKVSQTKG